MLDVLTNSPNKADSRYSTFSDDALRSIATDAARSLAGPEGRALRPRTANDPAKIPSDRRSVARRCDQTAIRRSLPGDEHRDPLEPLSKLAMVAHEELIRLYNIVRHAGYELRLRNDSGLVIDCGGNLATQGELIDRRSEERDEPSRPTARRQYESRPRGANGRAIETHRRSPHRGGTSAVNCAASVFDPAGHFIASLEILAIDLKQPVPVDRLARAILEAAARAIEERLFRDHYRHQWIIMVGPDAASGAAMLFAVDRSQHIVAADRYAHAVLARGSSALEAAGRGSRVSFWTLFEKDLTLFRGKDCRDIASQLVPVGTAESWSALITPPDGDLTPWREFDANLHTRPRIGGDGLIRQLASPVARGGLSPGVLRRVREYIDANLETNVGLDALSKVAGLSRCHFVRAFRQSVGTTPHNFLMYRRFCKAVELIADTNLPLAEIALAAGFSDQSHFSRRFRQYLGVSPSAFRRSQR